MQSGLFRMEDQEIGLILELVKHLLERNGGFVEVFDTG